MMGRHVYPPDVYPPAMCDSSAKLPESPDENLVARRDASKPCIKVIRSSLPDR
ncbi:MAG: hypothetical protein JW719_00305 [Pirellulales bacterium]|nr:hypothetical protein [Pirellulales bacterium]